MLTDFSKEILKVSVMRPVRRGGGDKTVLHKFLSKGKRLDEPRRG